MFHVKGLKLSDIGRLSEYWILYFSVRQGGTNWGFLNIVSTSL